MKVPCSDPSSSRALSAQAVLEVSEARSVLADADTLERSVYCNVGK